MNKTDGLAAAALAARLAIVNAAAARAQLVLSQSASVVAVT